MAKDFLKSDPIKDLESQLNADFNQLVRKVHRGLSTKKRSPVYTGFFASSWKAQTMGVRAKDKVENFKPWSGFAEIGKNKPYNPPNKVEARFPVERVFSIKKAKKTSWNKNLPSAGDKSYKIQPRFPVEKTFNFKKPVFIGNRAKYAAYALERGKVQVFIQGELGKLIKETMKEGKLFVASRKTAGFGSFKGGVGYTEF